MKYSKEAHKRIIENEAKRRRRSGTTVLWIVIAVITFIGVVLAFWASLASDVASARAAMAADKPSGGVGRVYTADILRYASGDGEEQAGTALRVWCETDDPLPEWWDPDGAEVVYTAPEPVRDIGAPDWNLNTSVTGYNGSMAEIWELDLLARVFYLEFWGSSDLCCRAGCDAILNLWSSGLYGRTLGEALSAVNAFGDYVYSVYPRVWTTDYNAEWLAWCYDFCLGRFLNGVEYTVMYFQKFQYHDPSWTVPAFEESGVYFSWGRSN